MTDLSQYREHLASPAWRTHSDALRGAVTCADCGFSFPVGSLTTHEDWYTRLRGELITNTAATRPLCHHCHVLADARRIVREGKGSLYIDLTRLLVRLVQRRPESIELLVRSHIPGESLLLQRDQERALLIPEKFLDQCSPASEIDVGSSARGRRYRLSGLEWGLPCFRLVSYPPEA